MARPECGPIPAHGCRPAGPAADQSWAASLKERARGQQPRQTRVVWPENALLSIARVSQGTRRTMAEKVSDAALDTLFRKARSYGAFANEPVSDAQLHAIYEIMKHGATTANSQPQRIVFLRSEAAKQRLAPALSKTNRDKTLAAPVVAIFAYDLKFSEHLDRFYHVPGAKNWYTTTPQLTEQTAFRNASLQAAYFMIAARALGLDCGPMSGFDNA